MPTAGVSLLMILIAAALLICCKRILPKSRPGRQRHPFISPDVRCDLGPTSPWQGQGVWTPGGNQLPAITYHHQPTPQAMAPLHIPLTFAPWDTPPRPSSRIAEVTTAEPSRAQVIDGCHASAQTPTSFGSATA